MIIFAMRKVHVLQVLHAVLIFGSKEEVDQSLYHSILFSDLRSVITHQYLKVNNQEIRYVISDQ